MRFVISCLLAAIWTVPATAWGIDANRLVYLQESDPYYVSRTFPKLVTPQWIGEEGVEAVVVLAIDDMRGHETWEAYLRPILERLKQIDGRAPVSIMTNQIDPQQPHLQTWLKEGLSLEVHTIDHPCPCLQGGDFAKAKSTYDRCVDQMNAIPGSRAVAFRMPCCDSLNTPSPRFYAEIFNRTTEHGNFLTIDSSVFNIITADDPELPRELVLDDRGQEIFRKYVPFKSFVNTIEDYPYPYVLMQLCWEFPCVVPSDWSAQHLQQPCNPLTVRDLQTALDAAVHKQGTYNLVFHPYNWIRNDQLIQIIDHAVARHGRKVKFLNFREAQQRIDQHLLAGQPLRAANGQDNGVRLLDVNNDGYLDVVIGNEHLQQTRLWLPVEKRWAETGFPCQLVNVDAAGNRHDAGVRFGVLRPDGFASLLVRNEQQSGAWYFDGRQWVEDKSLLAGLEIDGQPLKTAHAGRDLGVRLRDLDRDGRCELLVSNPDQQAIFGWSNGQWQKLSCTLPAGTMLVDRLGRDAGLRFVDVDEDGFDDVMFSDAQRFSLHLFESLDTGWARQVLAGNRGDAGALPVISRDGTNNGVWFHSRHMWVQNEDTNRLPDLVDRRSFNDLLRDLQPDGKSPQASLDAIKVRAGFRVELAAAEPLVMDPIAFAWGPDAKLWVVEMGDYPLKEPGKHTGRVRYLEDPDGDGRYDKSTLFLDNLDYPTGVTPWRNGVLVICAPDLFYAEDTDGDGKADRREVLFTGFGEGNQQHRVNGLKWGLDGWLYGANGDSGGKIRSLKTGQEVSISGRDFRIRPDEGLIDPQAGQSQFGRNRDDWDNWFGCNNANPMYHFVLADHYLRRNPHVPAIDGRVDVPEVPGIAPVYPRSRMLTRFNDFHTANRFTSANSTMIYRDDLFGPHFAGNVFISEPVHNLVHREVVEPRGLTFHSRRAPDEQESEFLASADNWFRPTMLQTGPDGALWIADMYRHVIEHPEWIPQEWQERLDLRAGHDRGRLYRVCPIGRPPRKITRLDQRDTPALVAALDSPSGWQRDAIQQLLLWRNAQDATPLLRQLVEQSDRPECRVQALCTLEGLKTLEPPSLLRALTDAHPGVRRQAVRISAQFLDDGQITAALAKLSIDEDPQVRLQLAYTLGEWQDSRSGELLGQLALAHRDDPWMTAAILSSVHRHNLATLLAAVLRVETNQDPPEQLVERLVALTTHLGEATSTTSVLQQVATPENGKFAPWQLTAVAGFLDALQRQSGRRHPAESNAALLAEIMRYARALSVDSSAADQDRVRAIGLLGREKQHIDDDLRRLESLLVPQSSGAVQLAAVQVLGRIDSARVPEVLLAPWKGYGPELRSAVLDVLFRRDKWIAALLQQIEQRQVLASDLDAARRQRLLRINNRALRSQAEKVLAAAADASRQQVIEQHREVLDRQGNPQSGGALFVKRCAVCHQLRGTGHAVGPDLAALTDNSPSFLLTAMLDPNRAVEAKYMDYVVVTDQGLTFTGMLANETGNSITLLGQEGKQQTILRNEIESLQSSGKSLMPEGLEKDLSAQDMADIIAYLRESGPPRKSFPGNQPALVKADDDGVLQLLATNAEIYGDSLVFEPQYKNLGYWSSMNDRAVWMIDVSRPGKYKLSLTYACHDSSAGNMLLIESGSRAISTKIAGTGTWDDYQQIDLGEIELPAGAQQIIFRPAEPVSGALLDLQSVNLVPIAP